MSCTVRGRESRGRMRGANRRRQGGAVELPARVHLRKCMHSGLEQLPKGSGCRTRQRTNGGRENILPRGAARRHLGCTCTSASLLWASGRRGHARRACLAVFQPKRLNRYVCWGASRGRTAYKRVEPRREKRQPRGPQLCARGGHATHLLCSTGAPS